MAKTPNKTSTITEIADFYKISRNHLVKVVHQLAQLGFIKSIRGKNGGIWLARPASEINIADVIKQCEKTFNLVECFDKDHNQCVITGYCKLRGILTKALDAYFSVLKKYSLADASNDDLSCVIKMGLKYKKIKKQS